MKLSPHKIDTTLISSFVARNTIFNNCVYLYFYNPLIVPWRQCHRYQALSYHDIMIELPIYLPTGRYSREPPINWASDIPIKLPITWATPIPIKFLEDKTKTILTEPNPYTSRSPNRTTSGSQNLPIKITRELHIPRSIPQSTGWSPKWDI